MDKSIIVLPGRQGDVLLIRVPQPIDTLKLKLVPREDGQVVLAHGEVTGHAHRLSSLECNLFIDERRLISEEDTVGIFSRLGGGAVGRPVPDKVLEVKETVMLTHEEHGPIELPPGQYIVRRQREYDPKGLRAIAD